MSGGQVWLEGKKQDLQSPFFHFRDLQKALHSPEGFEAGFQGFVVELRAL